MCIICVAKFLMLLFCFLTSFTVFPCSNLKFLFCWIKKIFMTLEVSNLEKPSPCWLIKLNSNFLQNTSISSLLKTSLTFKNYREFNSFKNTFLKEHSKSLVYSMKCMKSWTSDSMSRCSEFPDNTNAPKLGL